ncbi:lipopolysaccharide biosynthesis protein [Clostridium perfringens]|uniref:lipopolysaccharide biosynthesis protein n=1 Tax=Clostridium perfringens TaxID=1502 RepID=UPI001629C3D9|nr:lipopolysaccharide biosynthesis protein [Clostridium perfringens]EJT6501162.1 lipopolysaccharide biosynthesis protein [Clostridium perfringens]MDK3223012.1 lipopolysaccharide biosynthesis protein [Clostridium perfringens]MDM0833119.1 lipopolysaccharide biosynthesis protein [Clostridium perfringens]
MKKFINKLIQFSVGPVVGAFIGFITIPLTTNLISPAEYGKVSMFNTIQSILTMTVFLGMDQAFVRYYNSEKNKIKLLFNSIILPMVLVVLLISFIPFFSSNISEFLFGCDIYKIPVYFMMLTIPLMVIERFLLLQMRMEEKAIQYSIFNIFIKIAVFILTFILLIFVRRDFLSVVYSIIFGQMIGDLVLISMYIKKIKIKKNFIEKEKIKELAKFGVPLVPAAIIGLLLNSLDTIFLRHFCDFSQLGLYSAANKFVSILNIIQTSFTTFWVPIAYRWYNEKKSNAYFSIVSESIAFIMTIIFLIILLFKNIIVLVLSKNYLEAKYIAPFLLFFPIMYTMSETTTLGIPFSKKTYYNTVISTIALIINLILNILLIPKYGAIGAAIATALSYIVFFWTRTLISRKLWYNFKLTKFYIYTILLFLVSLLNIIIRSKYILVVNISAIILVIFINLKLIKNVINIYLYERIKE